MFPSHSLTTPNVFNKVILLIVFFGTFQRKVEMLHMPDYEEWQPMKISNCNI